MRYFPAFLDIRDRKVIVIGGNLSALKKAELMFRAGARVCVLNSKSEKSTEVIPVNTPYEIFDRHWEPSDFADTVIIISAISDEEENTSIAHYAKLNGSLFNAVDKPKISNFTTPAIVERGDIVIGVSTGGIAPVLARRVRLAIDSALPENLDLIADFIGRFRSTVASKIKSFDDRRRFWDRFLDGPFKVAIEKRDEAWAFEELNLALDSEKNHKPGLVYIVGAGPGDAELLTIKALNIIGKADVIVYDRLVSNEVLDKARRDAKVICVGKGIDYISWTQKAINNLLLEEARAGKIVVRLKGGDPYLFSRGGEETKYLIDNGVATSVVPGITAALGCGASAGIPMTHRDFAGAVTFVAAHRAEGRQKVDWGALAALKGTIVFYMGVGVAKEISINLQSEGISPNLPVAIIEQGTTKNERVFRCVISDLPKIVCQKNITAPALIIVGNVARHNWTKISDVNPEPLQIAV